MSKSRVTAACSKGFDTHWTAMVVSVSGIPSRAPGSAAQPQWRLPGILHACTTIVITPNTAAEVAVCGEVSGSLAAREALAHEPAFGIVAGQRQRVLIAVCRLLVVPGLVPEPAQDCGQQVVALQERIFAQRFQGTDPGIDSLDTRERNGAVQGHYGRVCQSDQLIVELENTHPVRRLAGCCSGVRCGDRRLHVKRRDAIAFRRPTQVTQPFTDQILIPARTILLMQ